MPQTQYGARQASLARGRHCGCSGRRKSITVVEASAVQRGAQVGHGRGQNRGDDQAGHAARQMIPDELRINSVGTRRRDQVRR